MYLMELSVNFKIRQYKNIKIKETKKWIEQKFAQKNGEKLVIHRKVHKVIHMKIMTKNVES